MTAAVRNNTVSYKDDIGSLCDVKEDKSLPYAECSQIPSTLYHSGTDHPCSLHGHRSQLTHSWLRNKQNLKPPAVGIL